MIVLTGGAGFIGSCLLSKLNALGHEDIIVVDHLNSLKEKNLKGKKYRQYFEKDKFLELLKSDRLDEEVYCIFHLGACSATTETNVEYLEKNNYQYSCAVADWALHHDARLIYASSAATYGDGSLGYSDEDETTVRLKPLNAYGESKQKFDLWVLAHDLQDKIAGLKFFNVFGPNEYHKGDMRSVIAKTYEKVVKEGRMGLFKSYLPQYKDGEQKRDFIYVKDAVDMILFFFDYQDINGIYNVGTGQARTWNDVAYALFAAVGKTANIDYIEMPETIKDKYQYFTQADMNKLKKAGYAKPLTKLEDAVVDYAGYLKGNSYL